MKSLIETKAPQWVDRGRIPFLDGLRVLAIFMVIVSHYATGASGFLAQVFNGHLGVTLFFVISGFLITLLLLREHQIFGRISLKGFYIRRMLRIFPAYYAYMFIGLILWGGGLIYVSAPYWVAGFTYTMCYMPSLNTALHIEHSWSLAVEEHFYLLWPLLLTFISLSRAWKLALIYIIGMPLIRYGVWALHKEWLDIDFCSITQMSSIATGCVFAFIVRGEALIKVGLWVKRFPLSLLLSGVLLLLLSTVACRSGKYVIMAADPVNAMACCMVMSGLLYSNSKFLTALFNNKISIFLGALSYSLYLWQQPFANNNIGSGWPVFWRLAAMLVCALLSFYFIEKPFLRMKEKAALLLR